MCARAAVLAVVLVHDVTLVCIRIVNVISTKDYEPVYGACSLLSRNVDWALNQLHVSRACGRVRGAEMGWRGHCDHSRGYVASAAGVAAAVAVAVGCVCVCASVRAAVAVWLCAM